jgi:hypothetical protein
VAKVAPAGPGGEVARLRATFAKKLPDAERALATEKCVATLVAAGVGVREVRAAGGSLEDVFASLTREDEAPGAGEADA